MPDSPPDLDTGEDTDVGPGRPSTTGAPRWVKVFGIIALVLALLLVVSQFVGGGHGPGRHTRSGDAPSSRVTEHRPPDGAH